MTTQRPKSYAIPSIDTVAESLFEDYKKGRFPESQFRGYQDAFGSRGHETIDKLKELIKEYEESKKPASREGDLPKRNGSAFDFSSPQSQPEVSAAPKTDDETFTQRGPGLNGSPK